MKKNHLFNQSTGKTFCGISHDNQLIAFDHEGDWFDSNVNPIDISNCQSVLCINCMKQFDIDLIDKFETDAFLIDYHSRLPIGKTAMKFFKSQSRLKRRSINLITYVSNLPEHSQSKPANQSIGKSEKGKARAENKANQSKKKANQSKPTDDKCKVIAKPKDDPIIELKDEIKTDDRSIDQKINDKKPLLIDLSNGPVTIETIDPNDDWAIGDPINDDSIFELAIGNDWKLVRHDQKVNQWKFVNRQVIKGIPKWIDDSEFIDYNEASQLIIEGYCE